MLDVDPDGTLMLAFRKAFAGRYTIISPSKVPDTYPVRTFKLPNAHAHTVEHIFDKFDERVKKEALGSVRLVGKPVLFPDGDLCITYMP